MRQNHLKTYMNESFISKTKELITMNIRKVVTKPWKLKKYFYNLAPVLVFACKEGH